MTPNGNTTVVVLSINLVGGVTLNRISRTEVNTQQDELGIEYKERLISGNVGTGRGSKLIMRSLSIHPRNSARTCVKCTCYCHHILWHGKQRIEISIELDPRDPISAPPGEGVSIGIPNQSSLKHRNSHHTDCQAPPKIGWGRIGRRQDANLFHYHRGTEHPNPPPEGRREGGPWAYHGVAFAGVEGGLLRAHGERVELRERVGGAPEGPVERPVRLLQARRLRLALLPGHPSQSPSQVVALRIRPAPAQSGRGTGALGDPGGETAPGGEVTSTRTKRRLYVSLCLRCCVFLFPVSVAPWLVGSSSLFISSSSRLVAASFAVGCAVAGGRARRLMPTLGPAWRWQERDGSVRARGTGAERTWGSTA